MPKARIVKVAFGVDATRDMWKYVEETTQYWKSKMRNFHENKLPEYARIYKGTPVNEIKNTPWPNAANNVIQVVATHSDQLLSRVMAIHMTDPLWVAKIFGDIEQGSGDEQRAVFETFMSDMALSSDELDFYRTEEAWFSGAIRNGTGIIEMPWEYHVENRLVDIEGIDFAVNKTEPFVTMDGPKPQNVPLNKFLTDLNVQKLSDSDFICRIKTVSKEQLRARKEMGIYNADVIDKIISQPDRSSNDYLQQYIAMSQGITDSIGGNANDEYDLYECWFKYWHNGSKYSLVAIHHPFSNTRLICFYNYYPDNMSIFEDAKLAYDDEQYLGYGFAEMLKGYQEEISTTHNQRTDAGSLNNTTAFRVDPSSKLHSILTFYPGVLIPAKAGEVERLDTSNAHASDTTSETLVNAYAKERSGIDPAIGGTGGGVVNSKRGIYSSQGTFAVLQQQNNRTSLRTSDMRTSHARAGQKLAVMYAHFGIGPKLRKFGSKADALNKAFENIKNGKLGMSMRAATASINKEMEKQNDILLSQTLQQMYSSDAQIIQAISTPGIPEELKGYYMQVLKAKQALMEDLLRAFGKEGADRLIPASAYTVKGRNEQFPGIGSGQGGASVIPAQASNTPTIPIGGDGFGSTVPQ